MGIIIALIIFLLALTLALLWFVFIVTLDALDLQYEFRDWILEKLNVKKTLDK